MSNKYYPVIVFEDFFHVSAQDKSLMTAEMLQAKQRDFGNNPWTGSAKILEDETGNFQKIYNKFYDTCLEIFGDLDVSGDGDSRRDCLTDCWCFGINNSYFNFDPHIHENCTINGVYYHNIPLLSEGHEKNDLWGSIWFSKFVDGRPTLWEYYKPKEGVMIIFPGDLHHDPFYVPTLEYRLVFNTEFRCTSKLSWADFHKYNIKKLLKEKKG